MARTEKDFWYGKTGFSASAFSGGIVLISLVRLGVGENKFWSSGRFKIKHFLILPMQTRCLDIVRITSDIKLKGMHIFLIAKTKHQDCSTFRSRL